MGKRVVKDRTKRGGWLYGPRAHRHPSDPRTQPSHARNVPSRAGPVDIAWSWAMVTQAALTKCLRAWQDLQASQQRNWNE